MVDMSRGHWSTLLRVVAIAAAALVLASCSSGPRAPALRDEAVYQNDREGFRFRVPEGWTQHAKSDLPPGKANKEHLLVSYRRSSKPASLEVSLADVPESADLATYLAGPSFGAKQWRKN